MLFAALLGGRRAGELATHAFVALLAFAFGLTVARQLGIDRTLVAGAVGVGVAGLVTVLRLRTEGFRQVLRYLALAPLAFLGLFLFGSESSALILDDDASAAVGVTVGAPAPIVFIVLDEVPAASLMRPDGTLNEERFPNFARLAEAGTWYRNASAVAPNTPLSVPTILDGKLPPSGSLPTSTDHPENLFTLLGESYDLDVTETVTELCPGSVCVTESDQSLGKFFSQLGQAISDATVVYGHTSLPRRFRDDLPAVDQSWGGFIDDTGPDAIEDTPSGSDDAPSDETQAEFLARQVRERSGDFPELDGETLREAIEGSMIEGEEDLLFVHEVFPHFPWVRTPTGATYPNREGPPGQEDSTWGDSAFLVTQGLQRHLLQLGYADAALGELIDKLEDDGVWDDALVVVTADHGIAFEEDTRARSPTGGNQHAVYRVPLFIKAPGDGGGEVDDDTARTIDILPTIVDLLDIESDFEFEGVSLVADERADDAPVVFRTGPEEVAGGVEEAIAVAERHAERLPHGEDWRAVAAPGPYGALVGMTVDELEADDGPDRSWSIDQDDELESVEVGTVVPLILTGEIEGGPKGRETLLVAVNGTVAGVVGFEPGEGPDSYSVLLDEAVLVDGDNEVELLAVTGRPSDPDVSLLGAPD